MLSQTQALQRTAPQCDFLTLSRVLSPMRLPIASSVSLHRASADWLFTYITPHFKNDIGCLLDSFHEYPYETHYLSSQHVLQVGCCP